MTRRILLVAALAAVAVAVPSAAQGATLERYDEVPRMPLRRREGDSNPRTSFPVTRFPVVPVQPLRHLSRR